MTAKSLALPMPTSRTVDGPLLELSGDKLLVKYDYEYDGGTVVWTEVTFEEVVAFEYRSNVTSRIGDFEGYNRLHIRFQSPYLTDVISLWTEKVGWQEWQQDQGGAGRFRHYVIYFNDAGSVNVVARTSSIEQ